MVRQQCVPLSVRRWVEQFERTVYKTAEIDKLTVQCIDGVTPMLFLRLDQARELLRATRTLREKLVIRYFMLNGLAPTELSLARLEGLDPVDCTLFLPKRHWKKNCLIDIDPETVKLQIIYAGNRTTGPLILGRQGGLKFNWLNRIVHHVADRTCIAGKEHINPLVLKRTFGKIWVRSRKIGKLKCPHCGCELDIDIEVPGGSICTLQKQFSHKHLWSTAHYLRFCLDDVKPDHKRVTAAFAKEARV